MELVAIFTSLEEIKHKIALGNSSFLSDLSKKCNKEIEQLELSMRYDLNYGVSELLNDILNNNYSCSNPDYNFHYGTLYLIICKYYGYQKEFYNDFAANFIYDKFPKQVYDKKYVITLPKFDFPDIISIERKDFASLKEHITSIISYKNDFINLNNHELENLKNDFIKLLEIAENDLKDIVIYITD